MTKMKASNILGLQGWTHVASVALEAGCKPIPIPNELDTGIDGFVELVQNEVATATFLAIQVKMGSSYFDKGRPRVQADKDHFLYWSNFSIPVILIAISEDRSKAYWMDVREYLSHRPELIAKGPYILWLPATNIFTADMFSSYTLSLLVKPLEFLKIVNGLVAEDPQERLAAISQMYPLRHEVAIPYILVAHLQHEQNQHNLRVICDFLSRYLSHPETSFNLHGMPAANAAKEFLGGVCRDAIIRILECIEDDNFNFDGAAEIWNIISNEEVWHRFDMFERGTVQQSMAVIVGACADGETLKGIIADNKPFGLCWNGCALLFSTKMANLKKMSLKRVRRNFDGRYSTSTKTVVALCWPSLPRAAVAYDCHR